MQFSWHTLFAKATPTNSRIHHDCNCYINKRETTKTYLTNHKGSISHHITPLVINSLMGGHTHTHIQTSWTEAISRNQARAGQRPAHAWFNNGYGELYTPTVVINLQTPSWKTTLIYCLPFFLKLLFTYKYPDLISSNLMSVVPLATPSVDIHKASFFIHILANTFHEF